MTTPNPELDAYELAKQIANHLGSPDCWKPQQSPYEGREGRYALVTREIDGAEFSLSTGEYRHDGRIVIRGRWPKYQDGSAYTPRESLSITCDAARAPASIARDIERRLLSKYEPAYQSALEDVRASDAAARDAWAEAQRLALAIGANPPSRDEHVRRYSNGDPIRIYGGPSTVYALKVYPWYREKSVLACFEVRGLDLQTTHQVMRLIEASERQDTDDTLESRAA